MNTEAVIKKYLEDNKITQAFVSEKINLSKPKLNMALNGKRRLSLEEYAAICGALGVNTDFFLKPVTPDGSGGG
jgi:transcriptional regulator with XRE-family HTH domain